MPETLSINSEELHEVLGQEPRGIVKWSVIIFPLIIISIVAVAYWVQYADIVSSKVTIMANNAPKSIVAKIDGKVLQLLVKEKTFVHKGTIIAYMESTADHAQVIKLSSELGTVLENINMGHWEVLSGLKTDSYTQLGEMQTSFQVFMMSYIQLQSYLEKGFYRQKKIMLSVDIENNILLNKGLHIQQSIFEKDLLIARQEFAVKEQLYKEKVIPLLEYRQEESKLLSKQLPLETIKTDIIRQESAITAKQEELLLLDQQINQQEKIFLQALSAFINEITKWKMQYLLTAPESGVLTFPGLLQNSQDVKSGQELCYIVPDNSEYYGELSLSQESFGKVKTGQKVMIKLSGYPAQEFGRLTGHISFISNVPNKEKQYITKVILDDGMLTDYGRKLEFKNSMTADADIITDKSRLLNKLLYTLRYMWNRKR
ncbi:HlyD family secretion protein [Chitinophaga polysaccharea]|uniref:HlyD family secretion protein n=1 Tax=Chitinophaga polysaccharea TaxID=1293035 RepID=UPI001159F329|nr:HlyD family efflux transporter periplasmic adaptor subunit [Chitinophaga polysaccharea]